MMGLFGKSPWGGALGGPVGDLIGGLFDNRPSLLAEVEMLFTDVESEGKKQGYTRAAAEYKKAFQAIEGEYNAAKQVIEYQKNMYDTQADALIKKLAELARQKKNLENQVAQKTKDVSIRYSIPISDIQGSLAAGTLVTGPATVDVLGIIYRHKERKLREAEQRGYQEARELYEQKIAQLKRELAALKQQGTADVKKLLNLIDEILDAIAEEQMKIAELQILL